MTLRVLDLDEKRVHIFHEMFLGGTELLVATAEQMLVHVDSGAGRSAPMPRDLLQRLGAIHRTHAQLAIPDVVGRPMRIDRA